MNEYELREQAKQAIQSETQIHPDVWQTECYPGSLDFTPIEKLLKALLVENTMMRIAIMKQVEINERIIESMRTLEGRGQERENDVERLDGRRPCFGPSQQVQGKGQPS